MRRALAGLALCAAALLPLPVYAEPPVELVVGSLIPLGTPWRAQLEAMEQEVERLSNGSIDVVLQSPGVMSEVELVREVRRGVRIQGASITTAALAEGSNVAQLQLVELPYLFQNSAEADYVLDEVIWTDMRQALYRRGFVLALWSENGWRSMATRGAPLYEPADLKGVKMRSQESAIHQEMFRAFGAQAVQKPMTEVLTSLNTGLIDGLDQPPLYLVTGGLSEPLNHYTLTRHIYQPTTIIVSRKFYDGLTSEQKAAIDAVKALAPQGRQQIRDEQAARLRTLRAQLNVIDLSPEQLAQWQSAARTVHTPFAATIEGGPELLSTIETALAAQRSK